MAKTRQRLTLDLDSLFPGDTITIGEQTIDIRPLGILQLAIIARKLKGFGGMLSKEGVTWDNYNQPENLLKLATVLLDQFPEILEEASNIALEDLQQLPLEIIVELLNKVLEVNMKSKEKLEGNWQSLAEKLNLVGTPKTKLQKRSKS